MTDHFDDEEDVFEEMIDDEENRPSTIASSGHKINESTKLQQSVSKVISPEELHAMEIKFDKVEKVLISSFRKIHLSNNKSTPCNEAHLKMSKSSSLVKSNPKSTSPKLLGKRNLLIKLSLKH